VLSSLPLELRLLHRVVLEVLLVLELVPLEVELILLELLVGLPLLPRERLAEEDFCDEEDFRFPDSDLFLFGIVANNIFNSFSSCSRRKDSYSNRGKSVDTFDLSS